MTITFDVDRFKALAADHGDDTPAAIARRTGIDPTLISRLLRGERQPRLTTITRAADTYGARVDDLIARGVAA